jgi:hypothetical protein
VDIDVATSSDKAEQEKLEDEEEHPDAGLFNGEVACSATSGMPLSASRGGGFTVLRSTLSHNVTNIEQTGRRWRMRHARQHKAHRAVEA